VKSLNDRRRACYTDGDAPCGPQDDDMQAALDALESVVRAECTDDDAWLSVNARVARLSTACELETASMAARAFGGPHGATWTRAAAGGSLPNDCLAEPHRALTALIDDAFRERNVCVASMGCDPSTAHAIEQSLAAEAVADIAESCSYLSSIVAVEPNEYVERTRAQLDCLIAAAYEDPSPLTLRCGPSVVMRDPPPPPGPNGYSRIVLDSAEYGTRCGGDVPHYPANNPYAFHIKLAPPGHPVENVLIYLEGGGACMFEDEVPAPGHAGCFSRYLEDPGLFEALDNQPWTYGIMSDNPAVSPFANWTKVFVPYCTQDLHMGNGVTNYYAQITVHRYGAINTRTALSYVRDLLWQELDARGGDGFRPDRVRAALAGFSAGGFGVLYNYHWVLDDLQWAHTAAFPDSALALDNIHDPFWSLRTLAPFVLAGGPDYNWAAQASQPPYCFGPDCAIGPELIAAHSARLKAVPEQQYMIISNQNDEVGQMATTFFDRNTTFADGRVNWINEARKGYCVTREHVGIHYFFMPFTETLHSTTMTDYYLSQAPVDGQTMNDWMASAFSDSNNVVDRVEEGDLTTAYPGVSPFPCDLP